MIKPIVLVGSVILAVICLNQATRGDDWGKFNQLRDAAATVGLVIASVPWLIEVRRYLWKYQASKNSAWRGTIFLLSAASILAFPLALCLAWCSNERRGPGFVQTLTQLSLIVFSSLIGFGLAAIVFLIQLVRDQWQPIPTTFVVLYQSAFWILLVWSFSGGR